MSVERVAGETARHLTAAVFASGNGYNATGTWGFAGSVIAIVTIGAIVIWQVRRQRR